MSTDLSKLSPEKQKEILEQARREMPLYFLKMNSPQEAFIRVKNRFGRTPKRRLWEQGNKGGKTFFSVAEDISHSFGFRVWLPADDPDHKVDIKVPNIGMIGGETIKHSIGEKIEPTLRLLIPPICKAIFKPGSTGVCSKIKIQFDAYGKKCGSEIYLRSYDEKADSFEGIDYDWIHWDEPPPEAHLKAAERGKAASNARSWFSMTPIKEPYIYSLFTQRAAIVC